VTSPAAIDTAQLQRALGEFGGSLSKLNGGSWPVYRIDLDDGTPLILKTYDPAYTGGPTREAYATKLLEGLDFPVTRYLVIDESRTRLPCSYVIATYLPGVSAASLAAHPQISEIYREMGSLLRRLHAVRLPSYGKFSGNGFVDPLVSNVENVRRMVTLAFAHFREAGADEGVASRLEELVEMRMDIALHGSGAVFAHNDLHLHNVLVTGGTEADLRLSGLIDFGNACSSDAVSDLARSLVTSDYQVPGSSAFIRAGYGQLHHPEPEAALEFYGVLHRLSLWWWLRQIDTVSSSMQHPLIHQIIWSAEQTNQLEISTYQPEMD
jgi:aminoglycoside phosphotransferase (APT) family kinase protein